MHSFHKHRFIHALVYFVSPCRMSATTPFHPYVPAGKYKVSGDKPTGPRAALFTDSRIREIAPLLDTMRVIAEPRGKTLAQV